MATPSHVVPSVKRTHHHHNSDNPIRWVPATQNETDYPAFAQIESHKDVARSALPANVIRHDVLELLASEVLQIGGGLIHELSIVGQKAESHGVHVI